MALLFGLMPFVILFGGAAIVIGLWMVVDRLIERRMRFSLLSLLIAMTVVAIAAYELRWLRDPYNWQLNAMHEVLASYPEIENIDVIGNEDVWYEVELVYFSYRGKRLFVEVPHGAGKSKMRHLIERTLKD